MAKKRFIGQSKAKPKMVFIITGAYGYRGRWLCECGKVNTFYMDNKSKNNIVVCGYCRSEYELKFINRKWTVKMIK